MSMAKGLTDLNITKDTVHQTEPPCQIANPIATCSNISQKSLRKNFIHIFILAQSKTGSIGLTCMKVRT